MSTRRTETKVDDFTHKEYGVRTVVQVSLALAGAIGVVAGALSVGFSLGRVFERIEWQHRFDKFRKGQEE